MSTFKILFYLRKNYLNKNKQAGIMVRITVDSVANRFNTETDVPPSAWNATAERAIGRSAEIIQVNRLLDEIRASLHTIYHDMQCRDNYVTAEKEIIALVQVRSYFKIQAQEKSHFFEDIRNKD